MAETQYDLTGLSEWRQRHDYTQPNVAALLNCSLRQLRRYERGYLPDLATAFKLEALSGIPIQRLFADAAIQARALLPDEVIAVPGRTDDNDGPIAGRVLALDPWTQGIGFAVLDGQKLVATGVKRLRNRPLQMRLRIQGRRAVDRLIIRYRPAVVVLPALEKSARRRSRFSRAFCLTMAAALKRQGLTVQRITQSEVARRFGHPFRNKHELALTVAQVFPQLQPKVPPPRKLWKPQDIRMSAFYAVGLALAEPLR